jgi:hypothetical protein
VPDTTAPGTRAVLYLREGCHLCGPARDLVARLAADAGVAWTEVDVDAADDETFRRFTELVPALTVDGALVGRWRLDEGEVKAALGVPAPSVGTAG